MKDCKSARLGLTILHKCGEKMKLCDRHGLPGMIAQGLHKKISINYIQKHIAGFSNIYSYVQCAHVAVV